LADFPAAPGKRGAPAQLIARKDKLDALAGRLELGGREGPRTIAFVGAGAHDLQSQLAAAFAEYMSWEGLRVTLLDAAEKAREELSAAFGEDETGDTPGQVRVATLDRLGARALRRLADDSDILMIDAPDALHGAGAERALEMADRIAWVVEEDNDDSREALEHWLSERPDLEDRLAGRVIIARRAA
jgi:hypothetical protein